MDKDAANLMQWLTTLGLHLNDVNDEAVKKLIPPQRRDMWRNIIKHVRPEEEVDLIKKSLLLHKLQNLQKPLMARVESDEDLVNALKYEELLTKYNKIEKEIVDIKIKNGAMQAHLSEINETNDNLKKEKDFTTSKSYYAEQKTGYYNKFYNVVRELSTFCKFFASETINDDLTPSDYEDSLIKCFAVVDEAKEAGTLTTSVNLGKDLCNVFYATIKDKDPAILLKTIGNNVKSHIEGSYRATNDAKKIEIDQKSKALEREKLFEEFFVKIMRKQMELQTLLKKSITEKERLAKQLVEATYKTQCDIIHQFELRDLSRTPEHLIKLKINLEDAFEQVVKNTLDSSRIIGWPKRMDNEGETVKQLDEIFHKTNALNSYIEHKKLLSCGLLRELHIKKNDFGLNEVNIILEKMAANYFQKVINTDEMNKFIKSMKNVAFRDVNNIQRPISELNIKPEAHGYRTLEEIADHIESIDVFAVLRKQFEQYDDIICAENTFDDFAEKDIILQAEFENIISLMKKDLEGLKFSIEDCKIAAVAEPEKKPEK